MAQDISGIVFIDLLPGLNLSGTTSSAKHALPAGFISLSASWIEELDSACATLQKAISNHATKMQQELRRKVVPINKVAVFMVCSIDLSHHRRMAARCLKTLKVMGLQHQDWWPLSAKANRMDK